MSIIGNIAEAFAALRALERPDVQTLGLKAIPFDSTGGGQGAAASVPFWGATPVMQEPLRPTRTRLDYSSVDAMFSSAFVAALSTITRALPQAMPEVVRDTDDGEEVVEGHPAAELLKRPNPYHTATQSWAAVATSYYLSGDSYMVIDRDGYREPRELYTVPYWGMTPAWPVDGSAFLSHYERKVNGKILRVESSDVLHFRNGIDHRAPSLGRCGVSPIESVLGEIFTDDEAATIVSTVLTNAGIAYVFTPDDDIEMSADDARAWEQKYDAQSRGARRGRSILFHVKMRAQELGLKPSEMDYREIRRVVEERVTAVMCVPAIRAGLGAGLERATYANFQEAGRALWEDCLVPLLRDFADVLTLQLLPQFPRSEGLRVRFSTAGVPALAEDADARQKRLDGQLAAGAITRNEYRVALGYDPDPARGDVYLVPTSAVEVPWQAPVEAAPALPDPAMKALTGHFETDAQAALALVNRYAERRFRLLLEAAPVEDE
jgi:HK97 family phage portal protein